MQNLNYMLENLIQRQSKTIFKWKHIQHYFCQYQTIQPKDVFTHVTRPKFFSSDISYYSKRSSRLICTEWYKSVILQTKP